MARPNASQRMALQRRQIDRAAPFETQLQQFVNILDERQQAVFAGVVDATYGSIVEGSPVTGAAGQPVDTGALRDSWKVTYERPGVAVIASDSPYARYVEHNTGNVRYANHGPHSVKQTRAGLPELAKRVARNVLARMGARA